VKRRTARATKRAQRKAAKEAGMKRPGGQSKYGRKSQWLRDATRRDENLGRQLAKEGGYAYVAERKLFGFDVTDSPKPWSAS
jgi:hypothetical protein